MVAVREAPDRRQGPRLALAAFVGGLAPGTTKERLREHFEDCGKILLAVIVAGGEAGRRVGKVKFSREAAAKLAVQEKDGSELDGCRLAVSLQPPERLGEEAFEAPPPHCPAIFAVGLGPETTSESLRAHFAHCGGVVRAEVARCRQTSRLLGHGKVEFASVAAKQLALQTLQESELDGKRISLRDGPGYPVFVGGLAPEVRAEDLTEHFANCGDVICATVHADREGLRKGSGRVELASEADRSRAIAQLHGSKLRGFPGSTLLVKEYAPSSEMAQRATPRESAVDVALSVFVMNLAPETTAEGLRQHFAACGRIVHAVVFPERDGRPARTGKVQFAKVGGKRAALNKMNFSQLDGTHVVVREHGPLRSEKETFPVLVGNLGPDTEVAKLAGLFLRCARLRDCRRLPGPDGPGRAGFARLDLLSDEARKRAVAELDGCELDGRALSVREWLPNGLTLYMSNVSFDVSEEQMRAHCQSYGQVVQCQCFVDRETGRPLGRFRVDFASPKDKEAALAQLPNTTIGGRALLVRDPATATVPGREIFAVWVGGVSADTGVEALREHFGSAGEIRDCRIVRDGATGQPKGVAKIEYTKRESQQKAVQALHLSELGGRTVSVREFVADPSGMDRLKREVFPVFVSGLSAETTVKDLIAHLQAFGDVRDCRILTHRETNRSRGLARVDFATEAEQLRAAAEANGSELDGRVLNVRRHDQLDHMGRPISQAGDSAGFAVFVTSLPTDTSVETVREHFAQVGQVLDVRLLLGTDGRSRGMARVSYAQERQAHKAVAMLNDSEVDGRIISVRPCADQSRGSVANSAGFTVSVGGLSPETTEEALRAHFGAVGAVKHCAVLQEQSAGRPLATARVEFASEDAQRAAAGKLHHSRLDGRTITVREVLAPKRPTAGQGGFWVVVEGLAQETTPGDLRLHFRDAGAIKDCRLVLDGETGRSRGIGKIEFAHEEGILRAIGEFGRIPLDGHTITVRKLDPSADGTAPGQPAMEAPAVHAGRAGVAAATASAPSKPPAPKTASATERRIDPDDGRAYTFAEMRARLCSRLSDAELSDRWAFDCAEAPEPSAGAAGRPSPGRRVDPEDGLEYGFEDFRAKALAEGFGDEEILEYWNKECLPPGAAVAPAPDHATGERRLDPEDGTSCTFEELEAKLRGQFSAEEILEYWRQDCAPLPAAGRAESAAR